MRELPRIAAGRRCGPCWTPRGKACRSHLERHLDAVLGLGTVVKDRAWGQQCMTLVVDCGGQMTMNKEREKCKSDWCSNTS